MGFSVIMFLLLLFTNGAAFIYFIVWQAVLCFLQFTHALILTFYFRKDVSIWPALRIYWTLMGIALMGWVLRKEPWFSPQLYTFLIFVLPWFTAIYITMLTYRYSNKDVPVE